MKLSINLASRPLTKSYSGFHAVDSGFRDNKQVIPQGKNVRKCERVKMRKYVDCEQPFFLLQGLVSERPIKTFSAFCIYLDSYELLRVTFSASDYCNSSRMYYGRRP